MRWAACQHERISRSLPQKLQVGHLGFSKGFPTQHTIMFETSGIQTAEGGLNWANSGDRTVGRRTEREPTGSQALAAGPSGHDSSGGLGCSLHRTDKTGGAHTSWLAHTEAEPRVRDRETVQKKKKSLHFNPPSTEQSILHAQKFAHPYLFVASLAVLSSRRKMLKGLGKKNVPV